MIRFLLAHLQVVHICSQSSLRNVRRALDSLPTGLYAFYEIAMARVKEQGENSSMVATTALSYVFCARRPLSVDELLHALSVEDGDTELYEDALPDIEFLLNSSAGLIRADLKNGSVGLVHHTLREYLQKHPDKVLEHLETAMARVCLTYLAFDEFESGPCSDGENLDQRLQKYRFLDYASHHWGYHFKEDQDEDEMELLQEFLHNPMKLASSIQVLHAPSHRRDKWYDRFPKQATPLQVAAHWGLDKVVAMLLQESVEVDSQDSQGATALQLAARNGHLHTVRLLRGRAARVEIMDHRGRTAVAWASRYGHKATVELLLEHGAKILEKDKEGWTALDWAVIGGHTETMKVLFSQCTDISLERSQLNTALILAAESGSHDLIPMLLDDGAQIDWKDEEGSTALTYAVPLGHEKAARALVERGADVNCPDNYDNVPLHWAITFPRIARLLLEHGALVNAGNNEGKTALHWAVEEGQLEVVGILLEFGSDVNAQDKFGFTALHSAALRGYETVAQLLLDKGADPNLMDEDGWTSLHPAALKQHGPVVDMLVGKVDNGHQITAEMVALLGDDMMRAVLDEMAQRKSAGSTVVIGLRTAVNNEHVERILALLEDGADIDAEDPVGGATALTLAAELGLNAIVQTLLENGARVNKPGRNGWTALHYAVDADQTALVGLLARHRANLEVRVHGWTPLLMAARNWLPPLATYFIRQGADIHAADYHGRTVLHWVALYGGKQLTRLLLGKGANVNATDRWGRTPLICALQKGESAVAKMLLNAGADATVTARDGTTPLHMAAFVGDRAIATKLLARGVDCDAAAQGGLTALHVAVFMGHDAVASLLLEKGADASGAARWCVGECVAGEGDTNHWRALDESLCRRLRQLFDEYEIPDDVEECGNSLTTQQLADISGHVRVRKLLKKHKARACQRKNVTSRLGALRLGSFDVDVSAKRNAQVATSLDGLSEKSSGMREIDQIRTPDNA
jgi:ankyrin repeat protein